MSCLVTSASFFSITSLTLATPITVHVDGSLAFTLSIIFTLSLTDRSLSSNSRQVEVFSWSLIWLANLWSNLSVFINLVDGRSQLSILICYLVAGAVGAEPDFYHTIFVLPAWVVVLAFGDRGHLSHKLKGLLKVFELKPPIKFTVLLFPHQLRASFIHLSTPAEDRTTRKAVNTKVS